LRFIGLDIHRDFCEVAISEGGSARSAGRVQSDPERLELFAQSLAPSDRVVLESTGNALANRYGSMSYFIARKSSRLG
jgi:transposase